jgi:SAM-dependent methyltransferase
MRLVEPLAGSRILDLRCGEGYVARQLMSGGAASVVGIDISAQMIERARASEQQAPLGIILRGARRAGADPPAPKRHLRSGSGRLLLQLSLAGRDDGGDEEVVRVLRPGGRFVFVVPIPPCRSCARRSRPSISTPMERGTSSGRDRLFEGRIWLRDGLGSTSLVSRMLTWRSIPHSSPPTPCSINPPPPVGH